MTDPKDDLPETSEEDIPAKEPTPGPLEENGLDTGAEDKPRPRPEGDEEVIEALERQDDAPALSDHERGGE